MTNSGTTSWAPPSSDSVAASATPPVSRWCSWPCPRRRPAWPTGVAGTFLAVGFAFGTALVSADLSASLVPVPGTTLEVAAESLYAVGYWISGLLALLVVATVLVSTTRTRRRTDRLAA